MDLTLAVVSATLVVVAPALYVGLTRPKAGEMTAAPARGILAPWLEYLPRPSMPIGATSTASTRSRPAGDRGPNVRLLMARQQRRVRQQQPAEQQLATPRWLLFAVAVIAIVAVLAFGIVQTLPKPRQVAWAKLGTQDVHSLAFMGGDPEHLLFGHHGGVSQSLDGGRTWAGLAVREDAMSMTPAANGSIVIAGHDVFSASSDGGATWAPIAADLPDLDIHGFTRDPADPARMWAYVATGGLWESDNSGLHWEQVHTENVVFPLAISDGSTTTLLAVDATGLVASTDGGRTFTTRGQPPTYPLTSLAATSDGRTIYAGAPDGLFRSDDGGRTWMPTGYVGSAFALATSPDGATVAIVSRQAEFFRSSDRGATWPGP